MGAFFQRTVSSKCVPQRACAVECGMCGDRSGRATAVEPKWGSIKWARLGCSGDGKCREWFCL